MKHPRKRGPYKKQLSIFELDELAEEQANSPVFVMNANGERQALEPWLKELRFNQALQIAQDILGEAINQQEFQDCWSRTKQLKEDKQEPTDPPNTATFGGYRLRRRSALNRDKANSSPRKKRKRW